jgi:hypothetical protein
VPRLESRTADSGIKIRIPLRSASCCAVERALQTDSTRAEEFDSKTVFERACEHPGPARPAKLFRRAILQESHDDLHWRKQSVLSFQLGSLAPSSAIRIPGPGGESGTPLGSVVIAGILPLL